MKIAIIGASSDKTKYGNKAVRAYKAQGHTVYPVNPKEKQIEGLKAYEKITDIPGRVDAASLYLPPEKGIKVLSQIAEKRVEKLYVNPGAESKQLVEEAEKLGLKPILTCSIRAIGINPLKL